MKPDRAALLDVIESVADGAALDWEALEAGLKDEQDRRLFAQLKVLARIAEVHRSQSDDDPGLLGPIAPSRPLGGKVIGTILPQRPLETLRVDDADALAAANAAAASDIGDEVALDGRDINGPDAYDAADAYDAYRDLSASLGGGAGTAAVSGDRPSRMWGHLELITRIGEGTFGEVYRARDTKLHREVAVKLLRVGGGQEDRQTDTVLREARILARVRHPNVVLVHGAETLEGRVGLWMELIRGNTLEQLIQAHGPYGAREAAVIGQDLCRALAAVHGAGLVHRDVKAQNVMREEGGRLVLMDFGAGQWVGGGVAAANVGRITGTPLYLAPEVLSGGEATTRSDIYSLGVLLYHLVTGSYPLRARSVDDLREAHRTGKRIRLHDARPDLQDNLVEVIERALEPDPARRFTSAGEMQAALTHALGVGVAGGTVAAREVIQPLVGPTDDAVARDSASSAVPGWSLILAACAVALAGGAIAAGLFGGGWNPFATPNTGRQTIAVLPIQNLGGTADPVLIEMQDAMISALGRISSVRAISRTSVMRYANSDKLMPEIGRELNADYVIESMATRDGDKIKLMPRLVRAGDDTQIWATTIERPLRQVLQMGGVALDVAGVLGAKVTPDERKGLIVEHTPETAAQTAYLEGRYQMTRQSADGYRAARTQFERAVELDPQYGRALAGLAQVYGLLAAYGVMPREEASRLMSGTAARAIAADTTLPDAHAQLANARFYFARDMSGAEDEFRRAIELNASDSETRAQFANFLAAKGDLKESVHQIEVAREAAPLSADVLGVEGVVRYYARDFDRSIAAYRRAVQFSPQPGKYLGLGRALSIKGDCAGAVEALEQAIRISKGEPNPRAELARTYALCGRRDEARQLLGELEQAAASGSARVSPHSRAYVYAALGEPEQAFALLGQAVDLKDPNLGWAKVDPRWDALRGDARFDTFLRGLGLGE